MGSLSIFIICFVLIGSIGSESEEGLVALAFIIPVFFLFLVIIWPVDGQMLARAASGMSLVEGGTFMMGQNQVTADNFYISGHEVTSGEWQELMGNNQVPLINNKNPAYRMPAANISWYDAVDYCNRRSWREGLNPAYTITGTDVIWNGGANGYRLPTEAEWECAYRTKTIKGNMYEWCWDAAGPSAGASRILRCGSWRTGWRALLAGRYSLAPMGRSKYTGFRVAINP
jgi:formylglycine-generating enzyme required for sulfatase activity